MVSNPITETVDGTVGRVNDNGFTLTGRDGWANLSKYADPRPVLPNSGERVRVGFDKSGFVRAVTVVATPDAAPVATTRAETTENGLPAKERRIIRMNALGHATAMLASGGQTAEPGAVFALAAELEAWVSRA